MNSAELSQAAQSLHAAREIWLFSHQRPDGDALGSSLGLALALQAMGKNVRVFNPDPVPDLLDFLPARHLVEPVPATPPSEHIFLTSLDTSTLPRLGPSFEAWQRPPHLNLDHHESNTRYARLNCVDPTEPSTASLVYRLIRDAGWPIPPQSAALLYVGLMTDTGSFRYRGTTASTLRIAAELVDAGADPAALAQACYQSISPARFALRQAALASLTLECQGQLSIMDLTPEMFAQSGAAPSDTEGLVEEALTIRSVQISMLSELKPGGALKISLRSKGRFNVSQIASEFGGGGHPGAAGINFTSNGPAHRDAVRARLRSLFNHDSHAPSS